MTGVTPAENHFAAENFTVSTVRRRLKIAIMFWFFFSNER